MARRKAKTPAEEFQRQLGRLMVDGKGNQVTVNGKSATVLEALVHQTINAAFKDPRIAVQLIDKFGTKADGTNEIDDMIKRLM